MANDRIYIKCRSCGEETTFAKYYPSLPYGMSDPDQIAGWVREHMKCSSRFGEISLRGDRCFDLVTESENYQYIADEETD